MKKYFGLILVLVIGLMVVGCGKQDLSKYVGTYVEEYEKYVHEQGDTIKIFNSLGEHILTAHIGDTIVKTYSGFVDVYKAQKGEEV